MILVHDSPHFGPSARSSPPASAPKQEAFHKVAANKFKKTSDPYVVSTLCDDKTTQVRSKTIMKTLDPEWGSPGKPEVLQFNEPLPDLTKKRAPGVAPPNPSIVLEVIDADERSPDDPMGMVVVPLSSLKVGQDVDKWYKVENSPGCTDASGDLHVIITLNAPQADVEDPEKEPKPADAAAKEAAKKRATEAKKKQEAGEPKDAVAEKKTKDEVAKNTEKEEKKKEVGAGKEEKAGSSKGAESEQKQKVRFDSPLRFKHCACSFRTAVH